MISFTTGRQVGAGRVGGTEGGTGPPRRPSLLPSTSALLVEEGGRRTASEVLLHSIDHDRTNSDGSIRSFVAAPLTHLSPCPSPRRARQIFTLLPIKTANLIHVLFDFDGIYITNGIFNELLRSIWESVKCPFHPAEVI